MVDDAVSSNGTAIASSCQARERAQPTQDSARHALVEPLRRRAVARVARVFVVGAVCVLQGRPRPARLGLRFGSRRLKDSDVRQVRFIHSCHGLIVGAGVVAEVRRVEREAHCDSQPRAANAGQLGLHDEAAAEQERAERARPES